MLMCSIGRRKNKAGKLEISWTLLKILQNAIIYPSDLELKLK